MEDEPRAPGRRGAFGVRKRGAGVINKRSGDRKAITNNVINSTRHNSSSHNSSHNSSHRFDRKKKKHKKSNNNLNPKSLCLDWTRRGHCPQYNEGSCNTMHVLRRVLLVDDAHRKGIYAMCSSMAPPSPIALQKLSGEEILPTTGIVQLFTASQDHCVKQWILVPSHYQQPPATAGAVASPPPVVTKLTAKLCQTWDVRAPVLSCVAFGDMVACGLKNGMIKLIDLQNNICTDLVGHTDEVQALRLIDGKLVSCDWGGHLIFWAPDPINRTFIKAASVDLDSNATCFVEVFHEELTHKRWELWVGGPGRIKIVNLAQLDAPYREIIMETNSKKKANDAGPLVMSMTVFEGHVICALLSLGIRVYRISDLCQVADNPKVAQKSSKHLLLCSMEGSVSNTGPVLICGSPNGVLTVLTLPTLEDIVSSRIQDTDVRAIHNIGGTPSYFATASMSGKIEVWYWSSP